ncbi:MAG: hypothetical protein J6K73_03445 [Clostridia bacterium]|nr:hypothetical protein [Clostridia bacterium]
MFIRKYGILVASVLLVIGGCIIGLLIRPLDRMFMWMLRILLLYSICLCVCWMWGAWQKQQFQKMEQFQCVALTKKQKALLYIAVVSLILLCTIPMGLAPSWNGEIPGHRNQYEVMTESILKGHLYMDYEVDPILSSLENPYDPQARQESGASFQWDHAFYNQKYYMYFGIVPVFLTFIPYRLITGMPLVTYHATQLYAALIILGIFTLFGLLIRLFFRNLSLGRYVALSSSFSVMSIWYSMATPALYCTAITSAVCLIVWSLYFFVRAVWAEQSENRQIACAFAGSCLGALAFGCRPPIALANLLVLPLLVAYLKRYKLSFRLFLKLCFAATPYLIVAVLLMTYNYLRFDNPFEFGQSYQLTVMDQSQYMQSVRTLDFSRIARSLISNFFAFHLPPSFGGVYCNFPMLLLGFGVFSRKVRGVLKNHHLHYFAYCLFLMPILITIIDILWSPYLIERYRMDIYFIMGILCFLVVCSYGAKKTKNWYFFDIFTYGLPFITFVTSIIFFLVPNDGNLTYHIFEMLQR